MTGNLQVLESEFKSLQTPLTIPLCRQGILEHSTYLFPRSERCISHMYAVLTADATNLINWTVFLHILIQPKLYELALRPVTQPILPTTRFDKETLCDISYFCRGTVEVIAFLGHSAVYLYFVTGISGQVLLVPSKRDKQYLPPKRR